MLVETNMDDAAFFGPHTNLCSQYHSYCREKGRIPTTGGTEYANPKDSRIFARAITHQDISEEFSIFGTTSSHSIPFSSVFQSTQDSASSPTSSIPNRFKGLIEIHSNHDISLTFNVHSNSPSNYPDSVTQPPAKIPCEIAVHFSHDKRLRSADLTPRDELVVFSNTEETKSTANKSPDDFVQVSAPSIPPSPAPSSYFHHSLGLVFSDDTNLRAFIAQHFQPNEAIREVAFHLFREGWLISNEKEPSLSADEMVVQKGLLPAGTYFSRFELFFDRNAKHRCHWMEGNVRCTHEASRKNRAIGHAHFHFNYKPFACVGDCGKPGCQQRFTCATVLKEHVGNRRRTQACEICQRVVNAQNMKRHMKRHNGR